MITQALVLHNNYYQSCKKKSYIQKIWRFYPKSGAIKYWLKLNLVVWRHPKAHKVHAPCMHVVGGTNESAAILQQLLIDCHKLAVRNGDV